VVGPIINNFDLKIFNNIWKSQAPSKVVIFSWQLLHDRVPTKENLLVRGVIQQGIGSNCVWCGNPCESSRHLFLHCKMALVVWYEICKWLGVVIVMPPNLCIIFYCMYEAASSKKARKGFLLVWHSALWCIWRARNSFIFKNIGKEPLKIVEQVKVLYWKWSVDRLRIPPCLFYEWLWDPGDCFLR
jgi:hypothetical protein